MTKHVFLTLLLALGSIPLAHAKVEVTLAQINDVYEIAPLSGGKSGGLARVATLKKELEKENPNTLLVLAGDFLSPSAMGLAKADGKSIHGAQMIDVLNFIGLGLGIFGNHEFDIGAESLNARIGEAKFEWLSGNIQDEEGKPYRGLPETSIREFTNENGEHARIGFVSATINSFKKGPWKAIPHLESLAAQIKAVKEKNVDAIVAVTHLSLAQDVEIAQTFPELSLVMGGHEHDNILIRRGSSFIPIVKADANAKSVYVHRLSVDATKHKTIIETKYVLMNETVKEDEPTATKVNFWKKKVFEAYRAAGLDPERIVGHTKVPLNGLESAVRSEPTTLTDLIAQSMLYDIPGAQVALYNGSSIRIDDILPIGDITEYDTIRMLPIADTIFGAKLPGSDLIKMISDNPAKRGTGPYLQIFGLTKDQIHPDQQYLVAINELVANALLKLGRLNKEDLVKGHESRQALINHLKAH